MPLARPRRQRNDDKGEWMSATRPLPWLQVRLTTPWRWLLAITLTVTLLWTALALVYSPLPFPGARAGLVLVVCGGWAIWRASSRWPVIAAGVLVLLWWGSWLAIAPSHDRPWRPEVAVMPRIEVDGDRILIHGYRDFDYRTVDDFTVRYQQRELRLSDLRSLDFFVSYWKPGPVAHTFVSFNFDNAEPVSISIETRPEVGEGFDPVASLFKGFELIYVVGSERDIVGVRSNHRDEQVYLYRTNLSPEAVRRLFLVYAQRIDELHTTPEFYHLLSNSCTINIVRYANRIGRVGRLDIRHVLNGWSDRYLYNAGLIDTTVPFAQLRQQSQINAKAMAADQDPAFSARIRDGLPAPAQRVAGE